MSCDRGIFVVVSLQNGGIPKSRMIKRVGIIKVKKYMNSFFKFRMKAFALMTLLLIGFSSAFAQQKKGTVAIIDAGSSGSRLYVYEGNGGEITQLFKSANSHAKLSGITTEHIDR